jgi:sialate O-acetylesterase
MMLRSLLLPCSLCLIAAFPAAARAAVVPAPIFGDGMVLQRDRPVPVWGRAAPGETVTVSFGGRTVSGKADADGRWKVALEPLAAEASPREMTIAGATDRLLYKDVLVGEVWLCSGQSNMGLEVRKVIDAADEIAAATDPQIRAFTAVYAPGKDGWYEFDDAQKRYAISPQEKCLGSWKPCVVKDVANVSAVGYFFARELKKRLDMPIGIVVCSTGATAIEAWISVEGLKAIPRYRSRAIAWEELAAAYLADKNAYPAAVEAQKKRVAAENKAWFAKLDAEDPGIEGRWMAPGLDASGWSAVDLPVTLDDNPIGSPIASVWFRKQVTIPAEWVGKELELHLGTIDAVDDTYVHGKPVGRTWFDREKYWEMPRVYAVPAEAVTGTTVSVAMRLLKLAYHMAPFGPAAEMKLVPKGSDAAAVSLAGEWRMRKAQDLEYGDQPQVSPFLATPPGGHYGNAGVQYNGLIHPIAPYAIRGAIWYQGEANAPFYIDYRSLLPGLITSWRKEWGYDFPFGVVQLADYWGQQTAPVERGGYTNLRESQALAAAATPGTFLATAVGVGEGNDIHPKRKQEVGRRLALNALGVVYGLEDRTFSGPTYTSMKVEGDRIRLSFDHARGLHAQGEPPVGFAIAGKDRAFYFARAKIDGEQVVVWSDKVPEPVAVRYAWATNPVCNLANDEELPMFQFRTDDWDLSQLVIPKDTIVIPAGWQPK